MNGEKNILIVRNPITYFFISYVFQIYEMRKGVKDSFTNNYNDQKEK